MKYMTSAPITMEILGTGEPAFTIPAATEVRRAHTLPQPAFWAKEWDGMPDHARRISDSIGILIKGDDTKNVVCTYPVFP